MWEVSVHSPLVFEDVQAYSTSDRADVGMPDFCDKSHLSKWRGQAKPTFIISLLHINKHLEVNLDVAMQVLFQLC